jgi:hypothetical protein
MGRPDLAMDVVEREAGCLRLLVVRVGAREARLVVVRAPRSARFVVRSGIVLPLEERSVLRTHLHCMDDQKTLFDLDCDH